MSNLKGLLCSVLTLFAAQPWPGCALPIPPSSPYPPGLDVFDLIPITEPVATVLAGTPLQFNGSFVGEGDLTEQLGWFPKPVSPATSNPPIDLNAFVQKNGKEGIVFWATRSAFEL